MRGQRGFTLVECLVALAIYALLIATLVTATKNSTDRITELETHALARLALANIMVDFQTNDDANHIGKTTGELTFGRQTYRWQISVAPSEAGFTRIATGEIFDTSGTRITTQKTLIVR